MPTELPRVEEEEEKEAGVGRGKLPQTLWGARYHHGNGDKHSLTPLCQGCLISVGETFAIFPPLCSPAIPRARVLLPVVGSSVVPPRLIPDVPSMSLLPVPEAAACPGLNESAVRVGAVRDLYAWVLRVPEADLAMTFQEVSALSSHSKPQTLAARQCHPQPATVPLCPWLPWDSWRCCLPTDPGGLGLQKHPGTVPGTGSGHCWGSSHCLHWPRGAGE